MKFKVAKYKALGNNFELYDMCTLATPLKPNYLRQGQSFVNNTSSFKVIMGFWHRKNAAVHKSSTGFTECCTDC